MSLPSLPSPSGMSAAERDRHQEPNADQQGETDTAEHRENAVPAIAGFGSAAVACAAKRPIQKLLMEWPKVVACGGLSVFRSPFRTGAAHIVRFRVVSVLFNRCCVPPRIGDSRNRLRNREGNNVSCT